jgi:hypothetical protein
MIDEPIRWSHAYGKPVVPSSWQMTACRACQSLSDRAYPRGQVWRAASWTSCTRDVKPSFA